MVTIGGAESTLPCGKEDILKAVGIRVKRWTDVHGDALPYYGVGDVEMT